MSFPFLAAGASILGSFLSGNAQRNAQKKQTQAQNQQLALQERMHNDNMGMIRPVYNNQVNYMSKINRMYGMGPVSAASGGPEGGQDFGSYVRNQPDLMSAYGASNGQYGDIEDFGRTHYQTHGQGEGRNVPVYASNLPAAGQVGGGGDWYSEFEASPEYQVAAGELPYQQAGMSRTLAARGLNGSGAALSGLAGLAARNGNQALGNYQGNLMRMAGMEPGSMDSATSQNNGYGQVSGNIINNIGDLRAKNTLSQADAWKSGIVDLAGVVKGRTTKNYMSAFGS